VRPSPDSLVHQQPAEEATKEVPAVADLAAADLEVAWVLAVVVEGQAVRSTSPTFVSFYLSCKLVADSLLTWTFSFLTLQDGRI